MVPPSALTASARPPVDSLDALTEQYLRANQALEDALALADAEDAEARDAARQALEDGLVIDQQQLSREAWEAKLDAYCHRISQLLALSKYRAAEGKRFYALSRGPRNEAEDMKLAIGRALLRIDPNSKRFSLRDHVVTLQASTETVVDNELLVPAEFFKPGELNRAAIKEAIKAGTSVPGAYLKQNLNCVIK